ncbi:gamma-glutamyltransferase [Sphingobium algorifonticola]|uniref:Glutathione hydrolase proenzyme n=1 Tax=Sphingobium algorifonticola TaxID=2008318 RepID=A0A437JA36_9SPHN|nr:gamma-glutamyltransferase [Sphingobium algorifonticola]RVT42367.1 gamma-glutamyltransferase [Sphingobium algorifonticola]
MIQRILIAFALIVLPVPALAQGVVTSADPRASDAGLEILRKGGSATDAAMAMMLALTVVEPQSSGIGGGGFLLHHDAKTGLIDTIDGRETAPAAATPTRFLGTDGKPLPFIQAWPGGYSVGVPGNVALMKAAHAKWGALPWAALFDPAIKLAEGGFDVTPRLFNALTGLQKIWADFPDAQKLYWRDGAPAPVGTRIRNPALAAVLKDIATRGPDAFYTGANAEAISATVGNAPKNPVPLTVADLAAYRAKERAPVCGPYRSYTICGMGPPSSGATTVLQILGMVERFDMQALGKDNPRAWHVIAEAMQLAYADRETYLADRDFVAVPVAGLIDPAYLKARSRLISADKTLGTYAAGTPPGAQPRTAALSSEVAGTTHFIAVDRSGDIATMTSTVESGFGSQLIANGYVLNNELTDFTFAPEKDGAPVANRVEAGKRPLSSMAPTIVYDAVGKPVFTVGAAGGKTIIMQVAKALIARLDWGLSAQDAIGLGLVYFNRDGIILEQGTILEPMKGAMEALGHKVNVAKLGLKANAAALEGGRWVGAADPRSPGESRTE